MSILFSFSTAPPFTPITLKTNNATTIRFSGNSIGVIAHAMSRNDKVGAPSGSLFVPSQLSVSEVSERRPILLEPESDEEEYYGVFKEYSSRNAITTKSGDCHLSLPLSKILLLPFREYMDSYEEAWDFMNQPFDDERCIHEPCYDGPIALVVDNNQVVAPAKYFSLKEQNLFKIPSETRRIIERPISSFGQWLVTEQRSLTLINLRKISFHWGITDLDHIECHLSSPLLDDIQNKDRLDLHRFASSSYYFYCYPKPWDCIIMAIDKSSGYLAYCGFNATPNCWIVLDSLRNYTTGDLLYFNKDSNSYVLPNAQSADLEVWRFQDRICSKTSEINATFMDDDEHPNNIYHHIHSYLVESLNGNILLVRRYVVTHEDYSDSGCNNNLFKTSNFQVFKFNFESKQWEVVQSLGDEALFVGSNSSFALSSNKYSEVIPNCIYFTDQLCHHGEDTLHGKDSGIFHLQDCTFTSLFSPDSNYTQPPIWLRPDERPWIQYNQQDDEGDHSKS